jgi:hypothetical protein
LLGLGISFCSPDARADSMDELRKKVTLGSEWTFGGIRTRGVEYRERMPVMQELKERILKACGMCVVEGLQGGYASRIRFPDGWYMDLTFDQDVIEVNSKPSTSLEFTKNKEPIARLFKEAMLMNLAPSKGAGHIHVGVESAFGNDARAFRNFIVDYFNHPGFVSGGMGESEPGLHDLPHEQRLQFAKIIEEFDQGRMERSILALAQRIQSEVYERALQVQDFESLDDNRRKYNALNFTRIDPSRPISEWTLEFRNVHQWSADMFLDQVEILDRMMHKALTAEHVVPVSPRLIEKYFKKDFTDYMDDVRRYLSSLGLQPARYEQMNRVGFIDYKYSRRLIRCTVAKLKDTFRAWAPRK